MEVEIICPVMISDGCRYFIKLLPTVELLSPVVCHRRIFKLLHEVIASLRHSLHTCTLMRVQMGSTSSPSGPAGYRQPIDNDQMVSSAEI